VLLIPLLASAAWAAASSGAAVARPSHRVTIQPPCHLPAVPQSFEQVDIGSLTGPFTVPASLRKPPLVEFDAPPYDGASVTDDLGLFASGPLKAGQVYNRSYFWAGSFGVTIDTTSTTVHGSIDVRMRARRRITLGHQVALQWATSHPRRYVFDVERMAPGSSRWQAFRAGTKTMLGCTTPKHTGTYQFRARMRNASTGKHSRYSPAIRVRVDP
jgi:hypothetical protein